VYYTYCPGRYKWRLSPSLCGQKINTAHPSIRQILEKPLWTWETYFYLLYWYYWVQLYIIIGVDVLCGILLNDASLENAWECHNARWFPLLIAVSQILGLETSAYRQWSNYALNS
jgi:hypothetical protein